MDVDWQVADATTVEFGQQIYELVLVLYLHLPRAQLPGVRPGPPPRWRPVAGCGVGGPQDRELLYDTSLLRAGAEGVDLERPIGERTVVDTLLVARRG